MKLIILILVSNYRWSKVNIAENTIGTIHNTTQIVDALMTIFYAATLFCPNTRIGTEKRTNLATDAPAETVVKREVPGARLLVGSSGKS